MTASPNSPLVNQADYHKDPSRRRGVVAVIFRQQRLLVIRRSQSVTAPGMLCLPGGGIEPGESEQEALCRQMREELNLSVSPVGLCWRSTTSWGTNLAWWHATIDEHEQPTANPDEVEEIFWMTQTEINRSQTMLPSLPQFITALAAGEVQIDASLLKEFAE